MPINVKLVTSSDQIINLEFPDDPTDDLIQKTIGGQYTTWALSGNELDVYWRSTNKQVLIIGEAPGQSVGTPAQKRKSCEISDREAVQIARNCREMAALLRDD